MSAQASEKNRPGPDLSGLKLIVGKDSQGAPLKDMVGFSSTVIRKVFNEGQPVVLTGTEEGDALGCGV